MKAIWYERTGPAADVLTIGDFAKPEPQAGDVLIRIRASGVNPSDVKARAGLRAGAGGMPYPRVILHSDGAGVIEAVGSPELTSLVVGERVWLRNAQWARPFGAAAKYVALPSAQAVRAPDGVDDMIGATLGIPAMTAAHCVLGDGPVAGRSLLVSGAAGRVGRLLVRMGAANGARVIATVGSARIQRPELPFYALMFKGVRIEYVLVYLLDGVERAAAIGAVNDAVARGLITGDDVRRFAVEDAAAAHEAVEAGVRDPIVIDFG